MTSTTQKSSFMVKPEPVEEEKEEKEEKEEENSSHTSNNPEDFLNDQDEGQEEEVHEEQEGQEEEEEKRSNDRETRRRRRNENRVKEEAHMRAKAEKRQEDDNEEEGNHHNVGIEHDDDDNGETEEAAAEIIDESEAMLRYKDKGGDEAERDGEGERDESLLGEPVHLAQDEENTSISINTTDSNDNNSDNNDNSSSHGVSESGSNGTRDSNNDTSTNTITATATATTTTTAAPENSNNRSDAQEEGKTKTGYTHSLPSTPLVMNARMRAAHEHVTKNEYDVDAWATYLTEIQTKPIVQCREFFERFFQVFPTASRQWRYWIDQELLLHNFELAESLLKKCLLQNLDIDLWKLYLRYIKQIKKNSEDEDKVVEEAFEFVVKHMGYDINSAPVWRAYVNVLKNVLAKSQGEFEEGEIIRKIRSVYQRACVLPILNGEILWREYETWEHSLNKNLAKTLLAEHQPKHVNARICARKRKEMREGIVTVLLAVPPQEEKVPQSRFRIKHFNQLLLWKKYIAFEQSNLMNIDILQLKKRVVFSYRQALLTLRHFPEVWHEYAMYLHNLGATEECVKVYEEACSALPNNILIHFIFADYQEERKLYKETRSIYHALLYGTPILKESSGGHHKEISGEESGGDLFSSSSSSSSSSVEAEENKHDDNNSDTMTDETSSSPSFSSERRQQQQHILTSEKEKSLVYCHLMRFAQRCEGKEAARKVLFQARRNCSLHHPYIEAARIEQHLNNEPKIASKIFSFGLQDFLTTPDYVTAYLDFLMEISDHTNCRVIFERVFAAATAAEKDLLNYEATPGSVPPRRAEDIATPAIWARFVHFERVTGDITAIIKAEKRRAEKLPSLRFHPFQELIDRHTLLDLLPCSQAYCESIAMGGAIEESSSKQFDGNRASTRVLTPAESKKIKRRYPRPNIGKLTTYKLGMEVKGAVGGRRLYADKPAPDALSTLIGMVPSKDVGGQRIDPLKLIACLSKITLPPVLGPHPGGDNKSGPMVTSSVKRKDADDDDDGGDADGAPTHDPYRKRSLARRREQSKSKFQRTS